MMLLTIKVHKMSTKQDREKRNSVFFFSLPVRKWYSLAASSLLISNFEIF